MDFDALPFPERRRPSVEVTLVGKDQKWAKND